MAPVEAPAIPPPTTPCAYDPAQKCNTDAELAGVILGYADALAAANRELEWLRTFFAKASSRP